MRSFSENIQSRHIRKYKNGRIILINARKIPARVPKPAKVPAKIEKRLHWTDVMKYDDGKNFPIGSTKGVLHLTDGDVYIAKEEDLFLYKTYSAFVSPLPTKNEDEWIAEFEYDLKGLKNMYENGDMTFSQALIDAEKISHEMESLVENDLQEPIGSITYSNGERGEIGHYSDYEAEYIDATWKSSGGYRGHYDLELDPNGPWAVYHEDVALAMSEDERNLGKFDEALRKYFDKMNIQYARVSLRTSNVMSANMFFLVEKSKLKIAQAYAKKLAKTLRREEDFDRETNPFADQMSKLLKTKSKKEIEDILPKDALNNAMVRELFDQAAELAKEKKDA